MTDEQLKMAVQNIGAYLEECYDESNTVEITAKVLESIKDNYEELIKKNDLINRQKAEIERLKKENKDITNQYLTADMYYEDNESKAVKEFAERICEGRVANDPVVIAVNCELKEMVGEKDV